MPMAALTWIGLILAVCPLAEAFAPAAGLLQLRPALGRAPTFARSRQLGLVMAEKQTFKNFDDMIENSKKPVLVDFYATWCGPCVMMAKELSLISESMEDKVSVVKIDTEKYPNIASRFQIYALPTCILFKGGEPVERVEGVVKHDDLKKLIESKL
mmetsp:Transcript_93945/g.137193  ORF Transcript_93945/g.137193 Transcript_93945/m.137193 type:complete len:156 (-) Transcript_93945:39-506(-)